MEQLSLVPVREFPLIKPGDDLARAISEALAKMDLPLAAGDVVVLAQKVVSKAEGRQVRLSDVTPSERAIEVAQQCAKDPRLVELVLSEASAVMRVRPGVLIVRHRLGLVLANAGIDQSNISHDAGEQALLLPLDPDASATRIRQGLAEACGVEVGVLVIDSLGRAWRMGTTGTAIGAAGLPTLLDLRGRPDLFGRTLQTSELGYADEIAAAASLVMGQANEGTPVVIVRGLKTDAPAGRAADLVRPAEKDLFP